MFQEVTLIGRLGGDPEMRYTPAGTAVTNFSFATSKKISKQTTPECPAGWKEAYNGKSWELTTWWRITVWGKQAESVNGYLSKGSQVFLKGEIGGQAENGSLNPRVWTGNDGVARASFELTARMVRFLDTRSESKPSAQTASSQDHPIPEEEIPF